jgi:hypothetical protein
VLYALVLWFVWLWQCYGPGIKRRHRIEGRTDKERQVRRNRGDCRAKLYFRTLAIRRTDPRFMSGVVQRTDAVEKVSARVRPVRKGDGKCLLGTRRSLIGRLIAWFSPAKSHRAQKATFSTASTICATLQSVSDNMSRGGSAPICGRIRWADQATGAASAGERFR